MPARAHLLDWALDEEGRPVGGIAVDVFNPGTTTAITETLFAQDDPDTTTLTNPFIAGADGKIEFFLANPKRVDLRLSKVGFTTRTVRADVTQLLPSTLVFKEDGTPLTQRAGVNFRDGLTALDDAVGNETDVDVDWAESADITGAVDIGDAAAAGVSLEATRGDHQHPFPAPNAGEVANVDFAIEQDGVSTRPSRADHKHDLAEPLAPTSINPDDVAAVGTGNAPSKEDHRHPILAASASETVDIGDVADEGIGADFARATHRHGVPAPGAGYPVDVGAGAEADGTATTPARSDHKHAAVGLDNAQHVVGLREIRVRKTADEAVASSTVLQDDNHLVFAIGASEEWAVEYVLFLKSISATPDFKCSITIPSGELGKAGGQVLLTTTTSSFSDMAAGVNEALGDANLLNAGVPANTAVLAIIRVYLRNGAVAGNVTLRWAQLTSSADAMNLLQDSHLIARRFV